MEQQLGGGAWRVDDVSQYLAISPRTVSRLMRRESLPFYKLGRVTLFRRADIDVWLEGFRVTDRPHDGVLVRRDDERDPVIREILAVHLDRVTRSHRGSR
jgi:excisionase family DNA binding protein